jgi:polyhydroxyalkanoate synthesis regulator phasin
MSNENKEGGSHDHPSLADLARKVLLAGIGAAVLAQEEADAFIQRLIEKGEIAEKDGRVLMQDLREKRTRKVEGLLDKRITSIVNRMDIPTKEDFDLLSEKISEISKKIEEL